MAATLDMAALEAWLGAYRAAWEGRDAGRAAALFARGATYLETPFGEPMVGPDGVREYWSRVTADQRDVAFESKPLAISGRTAVAEWKATFRLASSGATVDLDGIFLLAFDEEGLCTSLREWWHARQR